jgi:hypothetical protein
VDISIQIFVLFSVEQRQFGQDGRHFWTSNHRSFPISLGSNAPGDCNNSLDNASGVYVRHDRKTLAGYFFVFDFRLIIMFYNYLFHSLEAFETFRWINFWGQFSKNPITCK